MSSAIKYHKQKEITLERDNKILNDAFKSLKESTSTITNLNVKYRDMFVTLNQLMGKTSRISLHKIILCSILEPYDAF